jgi:hypothetical protein
MSGVAWSHDDRSSFTLTPSTISTTNHCNLQASPWMPNVHTQPRGTPGMLEYLPRSVITTTDSDLQPSDVISLFPEQPSKGKNVRTLRRQYMPRTATFAMRSNTIRQ